ncbi:phospholipid scramblase 1-like isoform X2 [Protopterus annectens]|nr:phospholipid scramblase 1-like isoform X2 [Protopterus annectens]
MPTPPPVINCPPGLEYLSQIDQLLVNQKVELFEAFTGIETNNKYEIKNGKGQRIYLASEENDCCTVQFCGPTRSYTIRILDNVGREVITLIRPYRCTSCLFPCFLQEMEVQAPPGITVGYVVQNWHPFLPKFTIQDDMKQDVLKIFGPYCTFGCITDSDFEVKSLDSPSTIGKISKQWSGVIKEMFTDGDHFGILFPMDLDVKTKAVMVGACFLIDFMFFEHSE